MLKTSKPKIKKQIEQNHSIPLSQISPNWNPIFFGTFALTEAPYTKKIFLRTVTRGSADILAQDDCSACDFVTSKPAEPSCAFSGLTWIPPWSPCCRPCLYLCCGVLSLPPNACLSKVWRQRAVWQRHFVVQASAVFLRSTGKGIADMKTVIFLAAHQDSGVRNANWSRCWLPPSPKLNAAHYHHGAHAVVHASICSVVCWVCLQTLVSLRSDISGKSDSDTLPFRPRQCCCGAQALALLLTWKR